MSTIGQVLDLDGMRREIADLGEQVAAPDLWDDQANATA
jgi:peptide chain release factor 2